jgi:hypothetical protein
MSRTLAAHARARVKLGGARRKGLSWTARSGRACANEELVPRVEVTGRAGSADELEARHTAPTWLRWGINVHTKY